MAEPQRYTRLPAFILGFHGCDRSLAEAIFRGKISDIKPSANDYDWLGRGSYFWENSPLRAWEWAHAMVGKPRRSGPPITKPAVVGAIIDPGNCLDFLDRRAVELAQHHYQQIVDECQNLGKDIPQNTNPPRMAGSPDRVYRRLDRAVIEAIHQSAEAAGFPAFDTVRGVFLEGTEIYPGAGFLERTHIQICVRNPAQIIGYFRPRV